MDQLASEYQSPSYQTPVQPSLAARTESGGKLHLVLFAATFLTTTIAYAWNISGLDIISDPSALSAGIPFAAALMTILLCHEFGHFFLARAHRVVATLPLFIPLLLPPYFFHFGTFGAFIRMRTLPPNRRALFDIGAAGPWAGFIVAFFAVILGLSLSEVRPLVGMEEGLILGNSLLFSWLTRLVLGVDPEKATIFLHPIGLAGWIGFLLTAINLLPAGQLDGGHVAYALFGRHHRWVSRGTITFLIVLALGVWPYWIVPALLFTFLGLNHPPPLDPITPLDRRRAIAAIMTIVILVLTFMPVPAEIVEPVQLPEGERIPISTPHRPTAGLAFPL